MSVNSRMKPALLQRKSMERTATGAEQGTWVEERAVSAAIYHADERILQGTARLRECTHTGLSLDKGIRGGAHRLIQDGHAYEVIAAIPEGRFCQLSLKVVGLIE